MTKLKNLFLDNDGQLQVPDFIEFLEEDLLNFENFPNENFTFIKDVFSDKKHWENENLWKILHMLTTEGLSAGQVNELSSLLAKNFKHYSKYMLCDMTCDFICRTNGGSAIPLLQMMAESASGNDVHTRSVLVGVNVMIHDENNSDAVLTEARRIANQLKPGCYS